MQSPPTHYEILKLSRDATEEEIRDAYRDLSATHRPGGNADDAMAGINAAHEVLSDPARRREYDRWLIEQSLDPKEAADLPAPPEPETRKEIENRASRYPTWCIVLGVLLFLLVLAYRVNNCWDDPSPVCFTQHWISPN